jgi:hypothetical protein
VQFLYNSKVMYSGILRFRKAQPTEIQNANIIKKKMVERVNLGHGSL